MELRGEQAGCHYITKLINIACGRNICISDFLKAIGSQSKLAILAGFLPFLHG